MRREFRYFLRSITISLLLISGSTCYGQLSTEGQDFWIGFMDNWLQDPNNPIILEIYISGDSATTGKYTVPKQPSINQSFTITPGITTKLTIPTSLMASGSEGAAQPKGIHLTTEDDVSVYAMNKRKFSADVANVLPTYSLGNEYYVMSHWENDNINNNANSKSEFVIVAISNGTKIEITPSVSTVGGKAAHAPFTITLNEGELYQVQANNDLTGTRLTGTNASGGCQNFAVFAGNQYTRVGNCTGTYGHDHLYAQQYPLNTWGKEFITVQYRGHASGDYVKILASEDNTKVLVNGNTYVLNQGKFKTLTLSGVNNIVADKPISVGQFALTAACGNSPVGDPFFILISPNEQLLKKITFNAPTIATVSEYYINIVAKTQDITSIKLDNQSISSSFNTVAGNTDFSYATIITNSGNHTITSLQGFIAYVYGYGTSESFGYSAGASLENLNVKVRITNSSGKILPSDSICLNDEAIFTPLADIRHNQFTWTFGDGTTEQTFSQDPVTYKFDKEGKYIFKLKATINNGGCSAGNEETYTQVIHVVNPKSKVIGPRSICPKTTGVTYAVDKSRPYSYEWFIKGGTIVQNYGDSIKVDWGDTNPNAWIKLLDHNTLGCYGDTVLFPVKINIQLAPEAPFGPDTLCSASMDHIMYNTFNITSSQFNWDADDGNIISGQGSSAISLDWNNYGIRKLWFEQTTTIDDICAGVSDTLYVFIQRNPSPDAVVLTVKDQYQMGETVLFDIEADTLYQMMNWKFGDAKHLDSVAIGSTNHVYPCPGIYDVTVNVYDTIGICPTKANGLHTIEIVSPQLEIIQVSTLLNNDSLIQVKWNIDNTDFNQNSVALKRQSVFPTSDQWTSIQTINKQPDSFTDNQVKSHTNIYDYKLESIANCPNPVSTEIQNNILLSATSEENTKANTSWNEYVNWPDGVAHYELYLRIDDGSLTKLSDLQETSYQFFYDSLGFDYCFRVKAIEQGGNNAFSWSNFSCAAFVPPIVVYNVFTPNNDSKNQFFTVDGIEYYKHSVIYIYNRWGHIVKELKAYQNDWNGDANGQEVSTGVYYYLLKLNDNRAPKQTFRGPLTILR